VSTKHRSSKVTRSVEVTADYQPIPSTKHPGFVLYRATYTETVTSVRNGKSSKPVVTERPMTGIAPRGALEKLLSGETTTMPRPVVKRDDWSSILSAVKPAFLEVARQIGFYTESGTNPYEGLTFEDPLTAMEAGEEVIFVEWHSAAHQMFDLEGRPLPVCLGFNYIDGGFSEDKYDLLKAASILLKRKDVTLHLAGGERSWQYCATKPDLTDPKLYIGNIPGYNAERGRSQCLSFRWHPTVEDYRKVFLAMEPKAYAALRTACFTTDIFGLRAGGATHFDDPHKTRRAERDDDSDDRDEDHA